MSIQAQALGGHIREKHLKIEFITKVPMTENTVKKITQDIIDIGKTCEVIKTLKVNNKLGIHSRPAAQIVKKIQKLKSSFVIEKDGKDIDPTSIMGIMAEGMSNGTRIKLKAKGTDMEVIEKEIDELLDLCEDGENLFREQKITINPSNSVDVGTKLDLLDDKIKFEMEVFMKLIAMTAEHHSLNGGLSESEFVAVAKEFRALANIKGIRNDILKVFRNISFKPETELEVYVKGSGTVFHLVGRDGVTRTIQMTNADENIVAQFNHIQISRPIDEFNNEIVGLLNGSHAYEVKRIDTKLRAYYGALNKFLAAPIDNFRPALKDALKKRMQYEHHRFIGIKHHNA